MKDYRIAASWGGHGLARSHSWSNATYAYDVSYPQWQAGYTSSRYHTVAWTFDTEAVRQAVAGGATVQEMYLQLRMSKLRDYTSWSLAYKGNAQTDGTAGTFTRVKKDQTTAYSAYGDNIALVRNGSYGCSVLEQGTNDNTTPDWLIKIDITGKAIPIYGLTLGAYNSSTTSRYYTFPSGDISEAVLVIVTDETEPEPPVPTGGNWKPVKALIYDGTKWVEASPMIFDGTEWKQFQGEVYQ